MTSIKPKLSMRPISTPVNLLVCGASGSGKSSFISAFIKMLNPDAAAAAESAAGGPGTKPEELKSSWKMSGITPDYPHAALSLADQRDKLATIGPISVPEAGRELLYRLQDCPGYGSTLDPAAYLKMLLTYIFEQQKKDFYQLHGSRGMPKSLVCGSLAHSVTACLYFLPPHGASKLDLVLMAGLSRYVALLPVVGKADTMTAAEAEDCCQLVQDMLATPRAYVHGLTTVNDRTAPGATACDGLDQLAGLLTGDGVYGLLDHAWDMYTNFCDGYNPDMGYNHFDPTQLADDICAAVQLPSCAALQDVKKELQDQKDRNQHLSMERDSLIMQLSLEQKEAHAQLEAAEAAKASEAQMLDDLWKLFTTYKSKIGHGGVHVSQYVGKGDIPEALKARLPGLE
ncbi:Septin-domain-containing protein [Scenedesmus sp. NREL 46B-D3]|nr:Septin-domain-containing protein [Scenedesmus sp. NREL 46B-D3]